MTAVKTSLWPLVALAAVVGFLLGLVAVGSRPATLRAPQIARLAQTGAQPLSVSIGPSVSGPASAEGVDFSAVASRLNEAVVNVDSAARGVDVDRPLRRPGRMLGGDQSGSREGAGSGFIIDKAGFILTNYHVVDPADRITVTLSDGRSFRATVVGADPVTDVALLQISAPGPLPIAPLGDSDALRVGEWVCAIGNPLSYVHSVTVGVVSFLGRKILNQSLDAFIQTDAAITFGSSGGPLINNRGEVIGITTLVSAEVANISFAIPINQIISILPQLRERGRVTRGFIDMGVRDVTPELRRALALPLDAGALIQDITADTPAEVAGLRPYDVVVSADNQPIQSEGALIRYVSSRAPGTLVRLEVWRDGAMKAVPIKLSERPLPRNAPPAALGVRATAIDPELLGLAVKDFDAATARRVPENIVGVVITDVDAAGPARLARIQRGQVLLEINRRRVSSAAEFRKVVSALKPGDAVAILIFDPLSGQRAICTFVIDS